MGINKVATPSVFQGNAFGLKWTGNVSDGMGYFPQYFKDSANLRVALPDSEVPVSTGLLDKTFRSPPGEPNALLCNTKGGMENSWSRGRTVLCLSERSFDGYLFLVSVH